MTETILIYDEEESRQATWAQMAQTARRYGLGNNAEMPVTQVGGNLNPVTPNAAPIYAPPPPSAPMQLVAASTDHLLITPSKNPGLVRLVRMQGSSKAQSWTLEATAASTLAAIVRSFGITLTDLREEEQLDE